MMNLKPGQTGTAIFTFQDNTQTPPVSYPLASSDTPTIDDPTKATLVVVKTGTTDGIVTATVTPVPGATPGPFTITCVGHGEADGSDDITGTLACALLGPDDNSVISSFTIP